VLREHLAEPRSLDALIGDLIMALGADGTDAEVRAAAQRQIAYFLLRGTMAYNAEARCCGRVCTSSIVESRARRSACIAVH